ncbi:hypothetical protein CN378_20315 [Bacillus sp. AFS015802]|jgi:hypothetical protein|uniref:hypothetical protein n=1 Tax=Bacillus sp. AFS015802 TaxID=2033486 RepID=UPI000BF8E997|nr:hypothetical protein [Bacillus sp. AFS015802]PFA62571.1 hypothetical protein CN378_20315 [Bacillus sp. AFS015802]
MDGIIFGFFALSGVLFLSMVYNFISIQRPGMYPPKNILKKRATILGSGGLITFLIGILFWFAVS